MKKRITILVLFSVLSVLVYPQVTGGNFTEADKSASNDNENNIFYVRFSYIQPIGAFGTEFSSIYSYEDAMGGGPGVGFGMGSIWHFNLSLPEFMKIGLNASYVDAYITFNKKPDNFEVYSNNIISDGLNLGPIITFTPNDIVYFDVYGNIGACFSFIRPEYNSLDISYYPSKSFSIGLQYKFGLNFRYKKLFAGLAFDFRKASAEYSMYSEEVYYTDELKFNLNTFTIHIGRAY